MFINKSILHKSLLIIASATSVQGFAAKPLDHPQLSLVTPPSKVYRVDSRNPDEIFRDGFTARGADYRIEQYVRGGTSLANAGYISTAENVDVAEKIATSQVNDTYRNAWACDSTGRVQCRSWVYEIRPTSTNFISVVANLRNNSRNARYMGQTEWLAVDRIYNEQIVSAYPVTRFFNLNTPDGPVIFQEANARQNPNYNQNNPGYEPINFASAEVGPTVRNCADLQCGSYAER